MHPGKHAYSPDQPSFFFFNDTATTEIYTLSLHDALPISPARHPGLAPLATPSPAPDRAGDRTTVDLSCLLLPVCEQHPQAAPRVKHFRSDRSLGNSEDRGDLTVRVAFDVEQHYRQAPPLGQLGERLAQPLVQRPPLGRRVGSRAARREPDVEWLDAPDRAAPPPIRGGIGDNPQQPGAERAPRVVLIELHERREHGILGGVVCVLRVAQHRARGAARRRAAPDAGRPAAPRPGPPPLFFKDTATTEIYPRSLRAALPPPTGPRPRRGRRPPGGRAAGAPRRVAHRRTAPPGSRT